MSGRAQMPVRAFVCALTRLNAHEASGRVAPIAHAGQPLSFEIGRHSARCVRCDGTQFMPSEPNAPLRFVAKLVCIACGETALHGDLIVRAVQDAAQHGRAMDAARRRFSAWAKPVRKKTPG